MWAAKKTKWVKENIYPLQVSRGRSVLVPVLSVGRGPVSRDDNSAYPMPALRALPVPLEVPLWQEKKEEGRGGCEEEEGVMKALLIRGHFCSPKFTYGKQCIHVDWDYIICPKIIIF